MLEDEKRLLIKIAHCYYEEGLTQEQIANKFSMSRQRVNRLIKSLVDKGIVTIKINGYEQSYVELEEKLEKQFNLKQVIITESEDEDFTKKLGDIAAEYLSSVIKTGSVISVSWGKTLAAVANSMPTVKMKDVSVIQCVGGNNVKDINIMTDEITRVISNKLNAKSYFMYAPCIVKDENTKKVIMNEATVKNVFNMIEKSNIALVGIGNIIEQSTLQKYEFLNNDEISLLQSNGVIGDICFLFYDINGNLIKTGLDKRVVGINASTLRNIPLVIGVAGGEKKKKAVLGALRSGLLDVLITDNETANYVFSSK